MAFHGFLTKLSQFTNSVAQPEKPIDELGILTFTDPLSEDLFNLWATVEELDKLPEAQAKQYTTKIATLIKQCRI